MSTPRHMYGHNKEWFVPGFIRVQVLFGFRSITGDIDVKHSDIESEYGDIYIVRSITRSRITTY